MARTTSLIRLVGGSRGLDATVVDLSLNPHDRADASGDRFVRAVRGTAVTSLSGLESQCRDRHRAEELAHVWRVAVFTAGRDRRVRARIYRYQGTYPLEPRRDDHGRWALALRGEEVRPGSGATADSPCEALSATSVWATLEASVDEAARRFTAVAALLPPGALADRAQASGRAVAACVSDAARLCQVGATVAPDWQPTMAADRGRALADRVCALIGTIDAATAHVVDLHLEVADAVNPSEPLAHLRAALSELTA